MSATGHAYTFCYCYAIFPKLILTQIDIFILHNPVAPLLNLKILEKSRLTKWSKHEIFLKDGQYYIA